MKIAHYLFITLFFLNAQSYCLSQTIEGVGDTDISIDELLKAGKVTNAIRCDSFVILGQTESFYYTNNKKVATTWGSRMTLLSDQTVFAMVDNGVFYHHDDKVHFAPYSQLKYIKWVTAAHGVRVAVLKFLY